MAYPAMAMSIDADDSDHDSYSLVLEVPSNFPAFPYDKPYDIQLDLMKHIYASIETRSLDMYSTSFC
jgi:hypothetical protein